MDAKGLPLPLGEVAERSEVGVGHGRKALSVTCGDSSPKGRAKGLRRVPFSFYSPTI